VCSCACRVVQTLKAKPLDVCIYLFMVVMACKVVIDHISLGLIRRVGVTKDALIFFPDVAHCLFYWSVFTVLCMLPLYVFNKLCAKWCLHLSKLS